MLALNEKTFPIGPEDTFICKGKLVTFMKLFIPYPSNWLQNAFKHCNIFKTPSTHLQDL